MFESSITAIMMVLGLVFLGGLMVAALIALIPKGPPPPLFKESHHHHHQHGKKPLPGWVKKKIQQAFKAGRDREKKER